MTHLVNGVGALSHIALSVSNPLGVMLLDANGALLLVANSFSAVLLEVGFTLVALACGWFWASVSACVVHGSSTVVFHGVALVEEEFANVRYDTLETFMNGGV